MIQYSKRIIRYEENYINTYPSLKTRPILNNQPNVVMDITFQLKNTTVKVHTLKARMSSAYTLSFNGNIQFLV